MLEETAATIYYLTETKNCQKLLEYGKSLELKEKIKFSWIWPTVENLKEFQTILKQYKIECLLSIGCGNGLLEWILKESIGLQIYGLEVDRAWWQSKYAIKQFIKINYIDDIDVKAADNELYLQQCCQANTWKFALLFCYFNNHEAFLNYLKMYKGKWLIIIGPKSDAGVHTDPTPLEPKFPSNTNWKLCTYFSIDNNDLIAIYNKL